MTVHRVAQVDGIRDGFRRGLGTEEHAQTART
jgi:hypothetical protein